MLKTFNAILKNNAIQWIDENPKINADSSVKVHITLLEEIGNPSIKSNGEKMAEALRKIANTNVFEEVNPSHWQEEIRQDRSLPNRD